MLIQYSPVIKMFRLSLFISLFIISLSFAQSDTMVVQMTDGQVVKYPVSKIKEISYTKIPVNVKDRALLNNVLRAFALYQNYPNPFNPSTTIEYRIPLSGQVKINIFNIQGRLIRTLSNSQQTTGTHKIIWDGKDNSGISAASGIYFCQILFKGNMLVKKLVLLK